VKIQCARLWGLSTRPSVPVRANLLSQISHCGRPARILGHPEVIEDQPYATLELPDFLCRAGHACSFNQTNGKPSKPGDVSQPVFGANTAPVFIPVPVEDIVTAPLNTPMAPIGLNLKTAVEREKAVQIIDVHNGMWKLCGHLFSDESMCTFPRCVKGLCRLS